MKTDTISIQEVYDRLTITPEQLRDFCIRWQIAELAVFGSILRDDFRSDGKNLSDADFLFCYLPNANMSLLRRARMAIELEALCHRSVDLILLKEVLTSHNLSRRNDILDSAMWIYGQKSR
ncbi:nucleotidyltransferase family protein [Limnothrix sp. PR1529]|uniref:nucleotidyltransferase family protein n=1 Tax=Limnothrix sp. PR1529 TaxID=1704291 RepID=UPI000C14D8BB|nr:nucleotidyltransferase domain-containing protein [Limnothrix sp. PR1529]